MEWRLYCVCAVLLIMFATTCCHGERDFYQILEVTRSATSRDIKRAYRKLALLLHPDKLDRDPTDEDVAAFVEIAQAYEVLSDPESRAFYDVHGQTPSSSSHPRATKVYQNEPFDMYSSFHNGAFEFHFHPREVKKVQPIVVAVTIPLHEVYNNSTHFVAIDRSRRCPRCHGSGADTPAHDHICPACLGTGRRFSVNTKHDKYRHAVRSKCNFCDGTGRVPSKPCSVCNGSRFIREDFHMNVTLPRGVNDGYEVHFPGQGNHELFHNDGDVIVIARIQPDQKFQVVGGVHLQMKAEISLMDALLGFKRFVVLPNREKIAISHQSVSFGSYEFRVPGKGLPSVDGEEWGDLVIQFDVRFPSRLTQTQRQTLLQILDEAEVELVEDVIRFKRLVQASAAWDSMSEENYCVTSVCGLDPFMSMRDITQEIIWCTTAGDDEGQE